MEFSFKPSLEHLCCVKLVLLQLQKELPLLEAACLRTSRLHQDDKSRLYWDPDAMYHLLWYKISDKYSKCTPLSKKLSSFVGPLFCEIDDWLKFCKSRWECSDVLLSILVNTPYCWSSDGSFNREKSATILVKDSTNSPTYRFIFACLFCLFDDVLDTWKTVDTFAKTYILRNAHDSITLWIEWLESSSKKDSQSFIKWALETEVYCRNVYVMKYIYKTLNSVEKLKFLTNALTKGEVNKDVICFGFPLVSRDVQNLTFKKFPVEVFECITSWPLRTNFSDIVDHLMPYLTCGAFCDILYMLLQQIKLQKKDYNELVVILKNFWSKCSLCFRDFAEKNISISEPLKIVLNHNFTDNFPVQTFLDSFDIDVWSLTPFVI